MNKDEIKEQFIDLSKKSSKNITLADILTIFADEDCKRDEIVEDTIEKIREFYRQKKRHSYAEIFIFLSQKHESWQNNKEQILDKLQTIDFNVEYIEKELNNKLAEDELELEKQFAKLKDHISLEIARVKFWYIKQNNIKDQILELEDELKKTKQDAEAIEKLNEKTCDEINGFRTTQVTILTVFIAILLTLVTDIRFSTSILEIADKIPIYKLVFLMTMGSFFILNISFVLLVFLAKIIGKSLAIDCLKQEGGSSRISKNECNECTKNCCFWKRLWNRYPYIVYLNIIFIIIIIIIVLYKKYCL